MARTTSFTSNTTASAAVTSTTVADLTEQVQQLSANGGEGFQGFRGFQGFQGAAGSSSSSSFYGDTGTVSVGIGSTATTPTFSSLRPLFLSNLYPDVTYATADLTITASPTDIYTVPTGKKAMVLQYGCRNQSGLSSLSYIAVKISSTYYRVDSSTLGTANASYEGIAGGTLNYVYTAGQTAAIVTSQSSSLRIIVLYCIFPDTVPIFSAIKYSGWVNGDNTLYTNSSYNCLISPSIITNMSLQPLSIANFSGGSVTYNAYVLPSSVTTTSNLYLYTTMTISNSSALTTSKYLSIPSGASIIINSGSSSDTQVAFMSFVGISS